MGTQKRVMRRSHSHKAGAEDSATSDCAACEEVLCFVHAVVDLAVWELPAVQMFLADCALHLLAAALDALFGDVLEEYDV